MFPKLCYSFGPVWYVNMMKSTITNNDKHHESVMVTPDSLSPLGKES